MACEWKTIFEKNGLKIESHRHNCKIDTCIDQGKTIYKISLFGTKTTLNETEFQELLNKIKGD